jgi:glycerol-3-phosphate dehydrogenase
MSKLRTHSPEFKAKVAMEAISGRKTLQEIAAEHAVHPMYGLPPMHRIGRFRPATLQGDPSAETL